MKIIAPILINLALFVSVIFGYIPLTNATNEGEPFVYDVDGLIEESNNFEKLIDSKISNIEFLDSNYCSEASCFGPSAFTGYYIVKNNDQMTDIFGKLTRKQIDSKYRFFYFGSPIRLFMVPRSVIKESSIKQKKTELLKTVTKQLAKAKILYHINNIYVEGGKAYEIYLTEFADIRTQDSLQSFLKTAGEGSGFTITVDKTSNGFRIAETRFITKTEIPKKVIDGFTAYGRNFSESQRVEKFYDYLSTQITYDSSLAKALSDAWKISGGDVAKANVIISDYIRNNDPERKLFTGIYTLINKNGVCDGMSKALGIMLFSNRLTGYSYPLIASGNGYHTFLSYKGRAFDLTVSGIKGKILGLNYDTDFPGSNYGSDYSFIRYETLFENTVR